MSKIIFLNGCGSSGKTSIARAIQDLSDDAWLTFGIDTFIHMTPILSDDKNVIKPEKSTNANVIPTLN